MLNRRSLEQHLSVSLRRQSMNEFSHNTGPREGEISLKPAQSAQSNSQTPTLMYVRRVTGENTLRIWMKKVETVDYSSYMEGRDFPFNPEYSSNYNSNRKRINFPFSQRIILFFSYPGWCLSTGNSHQILGYSESSQSIPFQWTINDVLLLSSFHFGFY